jgi:hypothetical protein
MRLINNDKCINNYNYLNINLEIDGRTPKRQESPMVPIGRVPYNPSKNNSFVTRSFGIWHDGNPRD